MASILRRILSVRKPKKVLTRKDSITGRNHTFEVPYLSRLDGNQLQPGQSLIARGYVTGSEGFIVNLTSGPNVELDEEDVGELDDRLLALRVDLPKGKVFLNACINGQWGKQAFVKQSYKEGDEFDIRIRCFEKHFEIYVEHKLIANFKHYVPMSNISHIYVTGDVRLYAVSWEGKLYNMPYTADIPGNFYVGRKLFVSAIADAKPKDFSIDFFAGDDVPFRVCASFVQKKVLRSSEISGSATTPETTYEGKIKFPLKAKRSFDILVYAADDKFLVFFNDVLYCTFDHRIPAASIERLQINGDIQLIGVHIK
uniref:Galectin n=1 Tax=Caenorhabditis japonica TaxID=281687 RepID=A0A8R1DTP4_CAEJA